MKFSLMRVVKLKYTVLHVFKVLNLWPITLSKFSTWIIKQVASAEAVHNQNTTQHKEFDCRILWFNKLKISYVKNKLCPRHCLDERAKTLDYNDREKNDFQVCHR